MNKIKSKAFVALLVVAMLVAQTVLPSFAADTAAEIKYPCSSGKHEVTETELKNATLLNTMEPNCSEAGFRIYSCPKKGCEGTVAVDIPATGVHTGDGKIVKKVDATCTKEGTKAYQLCTGCGAYLDENGKYIGNTEKSLVIPKTAHKYVLKNDVKAACTTAGYKEYECSDCKATKTTDKVNPLGHDYVWKDGKEPNCVEPGYTKYKECSRCGDIDPQNPKTEIPVVEHNLKVTLKDPTCTEIGTRTFKCENSDCTYFIPRVEEIPALGHTFKDHAAKAATCTADGNTAYKECTVCHKYFASDAKADSTDYKLLSDFKENKKGHKYVSTGYIAPTCTEEGTTGDIKCITCGEIIRKGEVLAKVPHEFGELVQAKAPACKEKGNVEYKDCKNCKQHFDKDGKVLETVEIPENGHTLRVTPKEATCTEAGYKITTCDVCNYTVSETIPAAGHKFKTVAEVAPTCEGKGTKEHKVCTVCEKLFAKDAKVDSKSPIEAKDLVIKEKGHVEEDVAKVIPTYTTPGNTAGKKCKVCGKLTGADVIPALRQSIRFYTVIEGINGASTAVNSGYIRVKVYFDVLKDELDENEIEAIAQMFGADLKISYDNTFSLMDEPKPDSSNLFSHFTYTPAKIANANGYVIIQCDMDKEVTGKTFTGVGNLLTTLTFRVSNEDSAVGDHDFVLSTINEGLDSAVTGGLKDAALEEKYDIAAEFVTGTITVEKLGDSNGDGFFTTADVLELSKYLETADLDTEYIAKFDLDKDGYITFMDLDLLRKAIVGNDEYLDIPVDPNAPAQEVTPEV